MNVPDIIAACLREESLPFLVIGGYAVIAHGYPRHTYDLDLLGRQDQRERWIAKFAQLGFSVFQQSRSFVQLRPGTEGIDVDLMLVNEPTFTGLLAQAIEIRINGLNGRMASLDHLLALKLHVIKQDLKHRVVKDLDDVIMLVKINGLDLNSEKYRKLFQKYADERIYEKVLRATTPG